MEQEAVKLKIREVATVKKFEGDAPKEGETKEPFETIIMVYEDSKLISKEIIHGAN